MTDVYEYIKNKLVEVEPEADIRPGSALHDLMISPLYSIMNPFVKAHESLIDLLSLKNPETMSEDEMDHLASNFFITRLTGNKVTGSVRIYFDRPVNVEIPKNTIFKTVDGKEFISKYTYSINRVEMAGNIENSLYYIGDILVEAVEPGEDYQIGANEINSVSSISILPSRVRNPQAFTQTSKKESNTELAERIKNTFISSSPSSVSAIKSTIKSNFNDIRSIEVVGAGSPYMRRDVIDIPVTNRSNFLGKQKGIVTYPHVPSVAYYKTHNAYSLTTESGINLPAISDFTKEFMHYQEIWRNDAYPYITEDEKELQIETFNGENWAYSGLGSNNYVNPGWRLKDLRYGVAGYNPFAFTLVPEESAIRLGIAQDDIPAETVVSTTLAIQLQELLEKVRDGYNDLYDITYINKLITEIQQSKNPSVVFDYYPVFYRDIGLNAGIAITGKFKTSSTADDNIMSYITVHRNGDSAISPHDGYGLAWMPGDGSKYNVYVVDNNILQDNVFVGKSMIVQDYGINNFLQAYQVTIDSDTWYNFRLEIAYDYSIKAWIQTSDIDPTSNPPITYGPIQFGGVRPLSADQGTFFGMSVAGTKNKEWYYGDIGITVINDNFPLHMFSMWLDSEYFQENDELNIKYYGVGEGLDFNNSVLENSVKLYVYNHNPGVDDWEELGGHTNDENGDKLVYTVSGVVPSVLYNTDYVKDQYLTVMAGADTRTQPNHRLKSYYIEVTTGDGTHTGNYTDIYIDSPNRIQTASYVGQVQNGVVYFQGLGPIQEVTSVQINGVTTLEDDEFSVSYLNVGEAYANGATIQIVPFDYKQTGTNVTINYRYLSDGPSMQSLVESDDFRLPSQNNLIKVMPSYTIQIDSLQYVGNITPSEIKELIKEYINNTTNKTFIVSDIINLLIQNGVRSVNTADIDISIRYGDIHGNRIVKKIINSYTIQGIGNFFVRDEDLAGIIQI